MQMATKSARCPKMEDVTVGVSTRRSVKKVLQTTRSDNGPPLRRSPRFNEKAKPSQAIIAAKRNARIRQGHKKIPDVVIKDIYHVAREAKDMIRKQTGIVYDKRMSEHSCLWDPNYPECPERLNRVLERCEALGLLTRCQFIEPREATEKEILVKHSLEQIEILKATSQCKDEEFLEELSSRYDAIYIHPRTYYLSLLSAGSTIELVDAVSTGKIQNGMAIVRPPGHHAMKSEYCGYCFFNNVALAATHALLHCDVSRILIVDWDVHHGQATQQMFYNDSRVVYFSLHRYEHGSFWPNLRESDFHYIGEGSGLGYNFNVPLNNVGMTDADYLAVFHQVLLPMAYEFQPELILISAGYDAAIGCPEGEMEVTPACYAHLLNSLLSLAGGKVAVILEGGYCLQSLAEGAALTLRALLGDPCPPLPNLDEPCEGIRETILNVIYAHRDFWQCYQFQEKYNVHAESDIKKSIVISMDKNLPPHEQRHLPCVKFLGSDEKPERFATRNCYPVQGQEFLCDVERRLNLLITNTKLTYAPHRVCLVYDERMMKHKNIADPGHPEKPERISAIFSRHQEYGLLEKCHILKARSVSQEELLLLHTQEHINMMQETSTMKLRELAKKQDDYRSIYLHPGSYQAACLAAGSVLQVVDSVLHGESRSGVAIVRPPGHHAEEDEPCGFCMFNNVSLAAKYAIEMHGLKRVLLLDWDVHHGNGSQHMFESDPRVLYISLHRYDDGSFFPGSTDANYNIVGSGKGEGFTVNIPWNKSGMGDADYLTAFCQVVLPICYQFNPELVLVSCGFDACIGDPLGGCKVSPEAYGHFTHLLTALAGGRVILSLEGGYNVTSISHAMPMCTKALLGDPLPPMTPNKVACPSAVASIKNVIRTQSHYWSALCFQVALPQEKVLPGKEPLEVKFETEMKLNENFREEYAESQERLTEINIAEPKQKSEVLFTKSNQFVSVKTEPEEAVSTEELNALQESLSKLILYEKQSEFFINTADKPLYSDVMMSPLELSSDTSPTCSSVGTESRMCSKSSSSNFKESPQDDKSDTLYSIESPILNLMHSCSISHKECASYDNSPTKLSCSDDGYKSEEQDISTLHELSHAEGYPVPLKIVLEDLETECEYEKRLPLSGGMVHKVADSENNQSGSGNQQEKYGDSEDGACASSSQNSDGGEGRQTLVDYLAGNMDMLLAGEMFAVVPLRSCPHLSSVQPVPNCGIDHKGPCIECGSTQENWVCLVCYTIHCGRYINEHMMIHGYEVSHPLTLSFSDLSVWCYVCEAYIDNQVLYSAKNAVHRSKFGEDLPWSYGDTSSSNPL
ncbi:histone deacetylase 6 isoform X1 [Periplaneta americana]|uniref:histone deacetylase 6 isoform X1 n=2 Tax=Periplaneta americana TaxID=6978 RepID=UPI0037E8B26B